MWVSGSSGFVVHTLNWCFLELRTLLPLTHIHLKGMPMKYVNHFVRLRQRLHCAVSVQRFYLGAYLKISICMDFMLHVLTPLTYVSQVPWRYYFNKNVMRNLQCALCLFCRPSGVCSPPCAVIPSINPLCHYSVLYSNGLRFPREAATACCGRHRYPSLPEVSNAKEEYGRCTLEWKRGRGKGCWRNTLSIAAFLLQGICIFILLET